MNQIAQSAIPLKRCSLLVSRNDRSVQEFREYWAGPHAAIALQIPEIARYTQNRLDKPLLTWGEEGASYRADGIVELEFTGPEGIALANQSDAVKSLLPQDEPNFLRGITLCRTLGGVQQVWPGMTKSMLAVHFQGDPRTGFKVLETALDKCGCVKFSVEAVVDSFHRETLEHDETVPHAFASLWFSDLTHLNSAVNPDARWHKDISNCVSRGSFWKCDPLKIVG